MTSGLSIHFNQWALALQCVFDQWYKSRHLHTTKIETQLNLVMGHKQLVIFEKKVTKRSQSLGGLEYANLQCPNLQILSPADEIKDKLVGQWIAMVSQQELWTKVSTVLISTL
mgnify:CR=1 FL=1